MTTRVLAQGTFDILHPGHLHYLREAADMGDELHVVVARTENVTHKADPIVPDAQRLEMVAALEPVDHARLGHRSDIFVPVEEIEPDVIALGYDQHHDDEEIESLLAQRGIECSVRRTTSRESDEAFLLSTGRIVDAVLRERREE